MSEVSLVDGHIDNTMTDEDIIKALECCRVENAIGTCKMRDCPFATNWKCEIAERGTYPINKLIKQALDLINRLKAENEKLNIELKAMRGAANSYKAEVERLQSANSYQKGLIDRMYIGQKSLVDYAKSEAIKEFAERLITESAWFDSNYDEWLISKDDIDNLVKEMTESK